MSNPEASDPARQHGSPRSDRLSASWAEFLFCAVVMLGGFIFLRDASHWGSYAYIGNAQYGDAQFWWNGALHFSHGIVAENPNLTFRMGYATFGGLLVAVCGPDYRIFHQILLGMFLVTSCGLYFSLRALAGRIAAAAAVLFFVFNPFTAEWLAVSTSDGLGLILNLAALLALIAGVRGELRLGWIALFGLLFSCGSLTRPLLTPFIVPAALAVLAAGWGRWRRAALALGVMVAAFGLPTVAWMGFMASTTGNFALTGESQDATGFYAASVPKIQVWQPEAYVPDLYVPVRQAAKLRFHTDKLTPRQLNAEYWTLTRENYLRHWRFHLERLGRHSSELARFTPERATDATPFSNQARTVAKWTLTIGLVVAALGRRRWIGAIATLILGGAWALWPSSQPWLVFGASALGLAALFFRNRPPFLWATYWWVGVLALYLTGGTWGPPVTPVQSLTALGYRLGFQMFFVADLGVICALGCLARWQFRPARAIQDPGWLTREAPFAARLIRLSLTAGLVFLGLLLCLGAGIVTSRLIARAHQPPVTYPDLNGLSSMAAVRDAQPIHDLTTLHAVILARTGAHLITSGMSFGFIWNLPGQQRSVLFLYQQENMRPVSMYPREFKVEVPRHLPEREWMDRQGAWLFRAFPDAAPFTFYPYYFQEPALQAFIPLFADGKSYDLAHATVFPMAKYASQLAATGELVFRGRQPEWSLNSGAQKFPRRFALRPIASGSAMAEFTLNLNRARGKKLLRFGVQLESADSAQPRVAPLQVRLTGSPAANNLPLWQTYLASTDSAPTTAEITPGPKTTELHLVCEHLLPTDTLWFYELVLTADDFTP